MDTPTEVGQFDRSETIEQVLWLDVSMDYVLLVDVLQRLDHLTDVVGCLLFRVFLLGPQSLVELTFRAVLEDQVDLVVVEEESIELDNVGVAKVTLDLDLPPELVLDATFEELLLVEHLEGDDVLATLLSGEVDVAKLATTQRFPNFEIVDSPLGAVEYFGLPQS